MRAIILAGGYGSRLAPLTLRVPKVMVPVAGEPSIMHQLKMLKTADVTEVIISLNHHQTLIEDELGDGKRMDMKITYAYEKSVSDADKPGAIGALHNLVLEFGAEDSIILGGDNTVYGLDLKKMMAQHKKLKSGVTIALYQLENKRLVELYGIATTDAKKKIISFQEKPSMETAKSTLASTVVKILSKEFLEKHLAKYIEEGRSRDHLGGLWQHYVDKMLLHGFVFQGVWGDTNSPESYVEINRKVMNYMQKSSIHPGASISPKAIINEPVRIGEGCIIEEDAVIGPYTCLEKNCKVEKGAKVEGSILFDSVTVSKHANVFDSVIDRNCEIGEDAKVDRYCMMGEGAILGHKAKLLSSSKLWPRIKLGKETFVEGEVSIRQE